MIYQLRANLYFLHPDALEDIKDKILDGWHAVQVLNPDTPSVEHSIIEVIENHHDDDPNEPCVVVFNKTSQED